MAYAAQVDLENQYSVDVVKRLADQDNDGTIGPDDQAAMDDALSSASSIIDAYLGTRYSVPISNPPTVLRDLCVDIAWYRLAHSRLKQTQEMRLRYEDAINLLKLIAAGKAAIGLDTDDDGVSDDQSAAMVARSAYLLRA